MDKHNKNNKAKRRHLLIIVSGVLVIAAVVLGSGLLFSNVLTPVPVESSMGSVLTSSSAFSGESSQGQASSTISSQNTGSGASQQASSEESSSQGVPPDETKTYQNEFPDLYVKKPDYIPHEKGDKVIYLTFDDGPFAGTTQLLDILDRYQIKATFFVVGRSGSCGVDVVPDMLKEVVRRGHTVGIHSYTHAFKQIYASVDAYLADFKKLRDSIVEITGTEPTVFRFPGGSINGYNKATGKAIIEEMTRRGYTYYDWDASSGDADSQAKSASQIQSALLSTIGGKEKSIVLCHDTNTKKSTVEAMPVFIETMLGKGYRFAALDPTVTPINFVWK